MTQRTIPVMAVQETVTRPVAVGILVDLSKYINFKWGLAASDLHFSINGAGTPLPQARLFEHDKNIRLPEHSKFTVTHDEQPTNSSSMTKLGGETTQYFFVDEDQYIYVKPIYTPVRAQINIDMTGKSREDVMYMYRELLSKLYSPISTYTHELEYHYFVPNYVMQLLIKTNDIMRENDVTAPTLKEYLNKHATKTLTVISDIAGGRKQFAVKEKGINVIGRFTHNADIPKPERDEELGIWKITLSYEYFYDRIDLVHIQHPVSIYQNLLPDRFLRLDQRVTPQATIAQSSEFADSVGSWKVNRYGALNEDWYFRTPYHDSWSIHYKPYDFDPVVSYLVASTNVVDEDIGDLKDAEPLILREYLLNYMRAVYDRMTVDGGSLVRIYMYSWDEIMNPSKYHVNDDLIVKTNVAFPLQPQYHVVLGFMNDIKNLKREYWAELANHGRFFRNYIMIYYPHLLPLLGGDVDDILDPGIVIEIIDEAANGKAKAPALVNRLMIVAD